MGLLQESGELVKQGYIQKEKTTLPERIWEVLGKLLQNDW